MYLVVFPSITHFKCVTSLYGDIKDLIIDVNSITIEVTISTECVLNKGVLISYNAQKGIVHASCLFYF